MTSVSYSRSLPIIATHFHLTTLFAARSLDENLHTRQGPVRTFLILARYATRTVFEEEIEIIRENGGPLRPSNFWQFLCAWTKFLRVELKLSVYETVLSLKSRVGLV
jgi:aarF domain-containing kinase